MSLEQKGSFVISYEVTETEMANQENYLVPYSHHAQTRAQQRGVPPQVLDWLLRYGKRNYDHHGGVRISFDKKAKRRLYHAEGETVERRYGKYLNTYLVASVDGPVITVARQQRRLKKPD